MKFTSNPIAEYPWIVHESRLSALRAFPNSKRLKGQTAFHTRIAGIDYRRAEALLLDGDDEPFQKVKTLLARGNLDQAKVEISSMRIQSSEAENELVLEKARVAAFEGEWNDCVALCSKALSANIPGVTRLTFLQVRALAYFEIGLFSQSMRDLECMESLRALYPHSPVLGYLKPMRIRLFSRMNEIERAQKLMAESWNEARAAEVNLDILLTLLRTEIDLRIFTGCDAQKLAIASLAVAEALGDKLYAALARVDILRSGLNRSELKQTLERDAEEYSKVKKLLGTLPQAAQSSEVLGPLESYQTLYLSQHGLLVHLEPFSAFHMKTDERLTQVISALGRGPHTKESLFLEVWKLSKYYPHRHENVVDQALSRIKKKYGLKLARQSGVITLNRFLSI